MRYNAKGIINSFAAVLLLILIAGECSSQTNFAVSWYMIRDDNTYKSRNEYDELINTASLYVTRAYAVDALRLQGYYGADFSAFNKNTDLQNHTHQIGILGRYLSGDLITDLGITARVRRNDAQYIYYNTDTYDFFMRLHYEPDLMSNYSVGLNYSRDEFREFEDLDNYSYRFYGKIQRSFQSRYSLSGEIGLGIKNYVNQSIFNYFGFAGGMRRSPRYTEEPLNATQFSASLNLGKSITDRLGISVALGGSRYIGDAIEAYSNGIYYYTENDLYDDPYSYEGAYVGINLTRQFGVGFQSKIGGEYHDKKYSGTPALTDTGEITGGNRKDSMVSYSFQVSKKFDTNWQFPKSVDVFFKFLLRNNASNDPYYDFDDHLGVFGFTISK